MPEFHHWGRKAVQDHAISKGLNFDFEGRAKPRPACQVRARAKPPQRSRDGMVKVGIYMSAAARDELKLFVMQRKAKGESRESLEGSLLEAINEWFVAKEAPFVVS